MEYSNLETAAEAMRIVVERGFLQQSSPQPSAAASAPSIQHVAQQLVAAVQAVDASERSTCLELAIRRAVTNCLGPQRVADFDVVAFLKVVCDTMLAISSGGAGHSLAEAAVAFRILEDVFEAVPISCMEAAWKVLDDRRSAWHALVQTGQNARLALLRLTSGLLRRLSRTQDTVMCGKVLLFLAFIIPLSERSGVNLSGAFNVENTTAYEGELEDHAQVVSPAFAYKAPAPAAPSAPIRPTAAKADAAKAPEKAADPTLDGRFALRPCYDAVHEAYLAAQAGQAASSTQFYRAFWRLQYLFMHPSSVSASVEGWQLFVGTVRAVLRGFEHEDVAAGFAEPRPNAPTALPAPAAAPAAGPGKAATASGRTDTALPPAIPTLALVTQDKFVPLTQRPLVAMGHVAAKGGEASTGGGGGGGGAGMVVEERQGGKQGEGSDIGSGSKFLTAPSLLSLELRDASLRRHVLLQCLIALQYYTLPRKNDKDSPTAPSAATDTPQLREACYALLRRMQPDGAAFAAAVGGILEREAHWSCWKVLGAADIAKPLKPAPVQEELEEGAGTKRGAQDELSGVRPSSKFARKGAPSSSRPLDWSSRGLMGDDQLLALCKDSSRAVRPSLAAYLVPYVLASDPSMGIEAEFSPAGDRTYMWRGMRVLAQESLPALVHAHGQAAQVHVEQVAAAMAAASAASKGKEEGKGGEKGAAPLPVLPATSPTGPSTFRAAVVGATGVRLPEPPQPKKEQQQEEEQAQEGGMEVEEEESKTVEEGAAGGPTDEPIGGPEDEQGVVEGGEKEEQEREGEAEGEQAAQTHPSVPPASTQEEDVEGEAPVEEEEDAGTEAEGAAQGGEGEGDEEGEEALEASTDAEGQAA